MKYLGIDFGTKRVGISTSDDDGSMAFPFKVIANSRTLVTQISVICKDEKIGTIVVGESLNFKNQHNIIMQEIYKFVEELKEHTNLPVAYMNEVLSSREATHIQGDNTENDASAATIVLQSFLDRKKHNDNLLKEQEPML